MPIGLKLSVISSICKYFLASNFKRQLAFLSSILNNIDEKRLFNGASLSDSLKRGGFDIRCMRKAQVMRRRLTKKEGLE